MTESKRMATWVIVVFAVLSVSVVASSFAAPRPGTTPSVAEKPSTGRPQRIHGSCGDVFDVEGFPSITLEEAMATLAKTDSEIAVPDPSTVGRPVKVFLDESARQDAGRYGLAVKYERGVKLFVSPGATDFEADAERTIVPYADGRQRGLQKQTVGGRDLWIHAGGIQVSERASYKVPPRIMWNHDGMTYTVVADDSSDLKVEDLQTVVDSMRR